MIFSQIEVTEMFFYTLISKHHRHSSTIQGATRLLPKCHLVLTADPVTHKELEVTDN